MSPVLALDLYVTLSFFILIVVTTFFSLIDITNSKADFYNELWGPAHLLMLGRSPYDTSSLQPELPAVWLPMSIGLFSFLGLFNEKVAVRIWFFLSIVQLALMVWFLIGNKRSVFVTTLVAILVYFFPPTINNFALGQFSIVTLLCMLAAAHFAGKEYSWVAAFFLALGLSKPQLGILAVFGLGVFYFQKNGFKRLFLFGLQVAIACITMSLPLFIAYPKWIPDWITSTRSNYYAWLHPSLLAELQRLIGGWGYVVWAAIFLFIIAAIYKLWAEKGGITAMAWSLALTLLVTPYVWSWDFILLLPLWILSFVATDWKGRVVLFAIYFIGVIGMVIIQLSDNSNYRFWWVPVWFILAIILTQLWDQQRQIHEKNILII